MTLGGERAILIDSRYVSRDMRGALFGAPRSASQGRPREGVRNAAGQAPRNPRIGRRPATMMMALLGA